MNPDQERLLRLLASDEFYMAGPDQRPLSVIAEVLLELVERQTQLEVELDGMVETVDCEGNRTTFAAPPPVDGFAFERKGRRGCIRDRLRKAVKNTILANAWGDDNVAKATDCLLAILDADPGHDATATFIKPGNSRELAVDDYRRVIQAIRRGE